MQSGIAYTMPAIDTDVKAVQRMFDINLFGPMRMVHHFHDMLIHAEGTIVNIGSIGGVIPFLYGCRFSKIPPIDIMIHQNTEKRTLDSFVQCKQGCPSPLGQHSPL